jgi:monoterpene epsilon-lactone hydrolase
MPDTSNSPTPYIPTSISSQAQDFIRNADMTVGRNDNTPDGIAARRQQLIEACKPAVDVACEMYLEGLEETEIKGVPVLVSIPKNYDEARDGQAILYFFGGAYVVGSPYEELPITAKMAYHSGVKVYAVDYRLAPEYPYPAALEDGMAVYEHMIERFGTAGLTVSGESAGGNLAIEVVLNARDRNMGMPCALALLSPWVDLSQSSESRHLHLGIDPTFSPQLGVKEEALLYAGERGLKSPEISPVYADYTPGFPPTLITTGTRDLLMSDCARLSTVMRQAGVEVDLHLWEGMWHVFEYFSDIPEGQQSLIEIAAYLANYLQVD